MVTSLLYYRTPTTRRTDVADPRNLPSTQILEFVQPNRILEGIKELYGNIITKQVSVNQTGKRRMFNRDDGMKNRDFTIMGRFDKTPQTTAFKKYSSKLLDTASIIPSPIGVGVAFVLSINVRVLA